MFQHFISGTIKRNRGHLCTDSFRWYHWSMWFGNLGQHKTIYLNSGIDSRNSMRSRHHLFASSLPRKSLFRSKIINKRNCFTIEFFWIGSHRIQWRKNQEPEGFDLVASHLAKKHLNRFTSKPKLTDIIFKLTLINTPMILSDSLNSSKSLNFHYISGKLQCTVEQKSSPTVQGKFFFMSYLRETKLNSKLFEFFLNDFCWIHWIQWIMTKHKIDMVTKNTPHLITVILSDEVVKNFIFTTMSG